VSHRQQSDLPDQLKFWNGKPYIGCALLGKNQPEAAPVLEFDGGTRNIPD